LPDRVENLGMTGGHARVQGVQASNDLCPDVIGNSCHYAEPVAHRQVHVMQLSHESIQVTS